MLCSIRECKWGSDRLFCAACQFTELPPLTVGEEMAVFAPTSELTATSLVEGEREESGDF